MGDATRIGLYKEHYLDGPPLYDPKCSHFAAFTSVFKQSEPGKTERSFARPPRKAQSKVCAFAQTAALGLCTLRLIHQSDKTGGLWVGCLMATRRSDREPSDSFESVRSGSRSFDQEKFSTRRHSRVALSEKRRIGAEIGRPRPQCEIRSQRSNPPLGLFLAIRHCDNA